MSRRKSTFLLVMLFFLTTAFGACGGGTPTQPPIEQAPATTEEACPYRLPWASTNGKFRVSQGISDPTNKSHTPGALEEYAIDFALPDGTPVLATKDGVVTKVHDGGTLYGDKDYVAYANYVIIGHGDGVFSAYWHLKAGIAVQQRQSVQQGQFIGYSGKTGWTDGGAHLHYQLQERGDKFGQSVPLCFAEVEGEIPQLDEHYASQNQEVVVQAPPVYGPAEEMPEVGGEVTGQEEVQPETPEEAAPQEGLANLIGIWKGTASGITDGGANFSQEVGFEITDVCSEGEYCLVSLEYPDDVIPYVGSEDEKHCFGFQEPIICFTPQSADSVFYEEAYPLTAQSGVLHRVQEGSETTGQSQIQPPSSSLDRQSTTSILEWLVYSLASGDELFFEVLTLETISYGPGFAGARTGLPSAEFLAMLRERISSSPACLGYSNGVSLWVWTSNWDPDWTYQDLVPSDELNLRFYKTRDGYHLGAAYFLPAPTLMEAPSVNAKPCPVP